MDIQQEFTGEQKEYLQGFVSGSSLLRSGMGLPFAPADNCAPSVANPVAEEISTGPDALGFIAQNHTLSEGKKLTEQEAAKRQKHPLDPWNDLVAYCAEGKFSKGTYALSFKYFGLFQTAPTQDAYMTRLRFAGGIVSAEQMRRVAAIAEEYCGGYAHVTTRANLQLREISARNGVNVLNAFYDCPILNKGAGADNIRNVTGSPNAGIDLQELFDVRGLCRDMHY